MNWINNIQTGWQRFRQAFHRETDSTLTLGSTIWRQSERERQPYQREEVLEQALEAWQVNPLARRIVGLTTQYVVGAGVQVDCTHEASRIFLQECWNHPLNHLETRLVEWCDELTRSGNLFLLVSTDASGMSYFRAVPATAIERIEHQPNDLEQARLLFPKPLLKTLTLHPGRPINPSRTSARRRVVSPPSCCTTPSNVRSAPSGERVISGRSCAGLRAMPTGWKTVRV